MPGLPASHRLSCAAAHRYPVHALTATAMPKRKVSSTEGVVKKHNRRSTELLAEPTPAKVETAP